MDEIPKQPPGPAMCLADTVQPSPKVFIATVQFYPDPTPRANRAFELARGFSKRGWDVEILLFWDDRDKTAHEKLADQYGITVHYLRKHAPDGKNRESFCTREFKSLRQIPLELWRRAPSFFAVPGSSYPYGALFGIVFRLLKKFSERPALFIGISNPVYVLLFSAVALKIFPRRKFVAIAEYGDPTSSKEDKLNPFIASAFDRVVVVTEAMREWYKRFKRDEDIFVVPHAFDLREPTRAVYKRNPVPSFAYAGRFWQQTRDPSFFC